MNLKDYAAIGVSRATVGILASCLSALSGEVFNVPLGFCPLSIKNILKVGFISAGTSVVIPGIIDQIKPIKDEMRKDLLPKPSTRPTDINSK